MKSIDEIKQMLEQSQTDGVIAAVDELAAHRGGMSAKNLATAFYLRGNAYRQRGEWGKAMNSYLESIDLDPDGPAQAAYRQAQQILGYYCKDYYNP
ncbi:MAG: tetratricopeptide repeat protein [Muribaculaceae bacterium]|nr:tetratricopeptide repeat protein [Muribaculaceae bacterium]